MASGGMILVKYLLFFFNFLFWLSGLALIIVGAVIKLNYGDFIQVASSSISTGPIFLIIIGAVIFIVGFLGCCGAWKENYCMVATFAGLLVIIFILEIAAGAVAYAYKGKIENIVKKGVDNAVSKYNETVYGKALDVVQHKFKCCGGSNGSYTYVQDDIKIPKSCCKNEDNCTLVAGDPSLNNEGCIMKVKDFLKSHLAIVGGVGVGIAFIQLIGIIFACCLMRSIKKEYEVM